MWGQPDCRKQLVQKKIFGHQSRTYFCDIPVFPSRFLTSESHKNWDFKSRNRRINLELLAKSTHIVHETKSSFNFLRLNMRVENMRYYFIHDSKSNLISLSQFYKPQLRHPSQMHLGRATVLVSIGLRSWKLHLSRHQTVSSSLLEALLSVLQRIRHHCTA